MRDHLTILTAFHTFRASFDEQAFERVCVVAACDYRRWVSRMLPVSLEQGKRGDELELPASAVLMCWHAHMLNPGVYHRDLDGAYRSLRGRAYPVHEVVGPTCPLYGVPVIPTRIELTESGGSFAI